jgi:hypothetical protein
MNSQHLTTVVHSTPGVECPLSEWADAGQSLHPLGCLGQEVVAKF